jgi:hypothetical protein
MQRKSSFSAEYKLFCRLLQEARAKASLTQEAMAMGLFPLEAPRFAEDDFAQHVAEAVREDEDQGAGAVEMSLVLRTLEERLARQLRERGQVDQEAP